MRSERSSGPRCGFFRMRIVFPAAVVYSLSAETKGMAVRNSKNGGTMSNRASRNSSGYPSIEAQIFRSRMRRGE